MQGTIKTFLPEKRYGFIKGDDDKDYFFHLDEFKNLPNHNNLCEGSLVEFDQQATPKGYKARKCRLLDTVDVTTYIAPNEFITSRSGSVLGWEIVGGGQWIVRGTSKDSPDAAKRDAKNKASQQLGANTLLFFEYSKSTGSSGNYNYSIHHYKGVAVILAKKSAIGQYRISDFAGLDQRAANLKQKLVEMTIRKQNERAWMLLIGVVLAIGGFMASPVMGIIILIISIAIFLNKNSDNSDWLQRL